MISRSNIVDGSKPYIVEDRPMISRSSGDRVKILHLIQPGKEETGCLTCFYAPPSFPAIISHLLPCIDYPEYILREVHSSQYIYIRENSIEVNQPTIQPARSESVLGNVLCCGHSSTDLIVLDQVTVIYYDDLIMDEIRNDTRVCNPLQTFCCGGKGEEVRLESTFCGGLCYRGRRGTRGCFGCCCMPLCIPVGCPECLCPCAARKTLFVENADAAVDIIQKARDNAKIRLNVMER
ncbi:hypothetical protein QTG54_016771 [Skeletonema marinoi]|uniref:Uncharacterized protein n=1 Tax=Skeletonema marinoi TaxID=267567 RepID=A0A6U3UST1_9STRA|nr:hypothetical protein QTG54_016771 [Skeletonema marinoi]|mmetsp:Transcript_1429/g.2887  ORF Transcript_1429/g.2887 Transcript_1429/m.2887 type:complete len:236 (-) Transcript_1429:644-1351(-)